MPSNQAQPISLYTLFPKRIMLVPYEDVAVGSPSITTIDGITTANAVILNEPINDDEQSVITIHEDGVVVTKSKTSEKIKQLDAGGIGTLDERTMERTLTVEINVNGFSYEIDAIKEGYNPLDASVINNNLKISKSAAGDTASAGIVKTGRVDKQKWFIVAEVDMSQEGDAGTLYFFFPRCIVVDDDNTVNMKGERNMCKLTFESLKVSASSQLANLKTFAEVINNGYELSYVANENGVTYSDVP